MTKIASFEKFWNSSGFRKIRKAACKDEFYKILEEEGINTNYQLMNFTERLIKSSKERLQYIRTVNGNLEGEQHPLTWLNRREYKNPPDAELHIRQTPDSRKASKLRRDLKEVENFIRKCKIPDSFTTFRGEERRKLQLRGLNARRDELIDQIKELGEGQVLFDAPK